MDGHTKRMTITPQQVSLQESCVWLGLGNKSILVNIRERL